MRRRLAGSLLLLFCWTPLGCAFDHDHRAWTSLLERHVAWLPGEHESRVSYAGFAKQRGSLQAYLATLNSVTEGEFTSWPREQRLAFLLNAYNAYTVELILTRYPDLQSIRDLGSVLRSPWKKRFFNLLGKPRSLDDIEHGMIRAPGVFDDPRIHMAANCASIGCPALRHEAYTANRLDQQLENQVERFLSDPTRNRYNPQTQALEISKIFDWYADDFSRGHRGTRSVKAFLALYAKQLTSDADGERRVRQMQAPLRFLDYDWKLNVQ
jgi:hypothetical protein